MFPPRASGGRPVRSRAIAASVIHISSWSHLGAGDTDPRCHPAEKGEILHKQLFTGAFSACICHLKCTPQLHWSQLKDSPSWQRTLSQTHEAYVCRISARAEPLLHTFITRTSKVWQYVSGDPWWTHWSVEFSRRKNEGLLFCRSSMWDVTQVHWWTDASSSQLMTELKLQAEQGTSFYTAACKD